MAKQKQKSHSGTKKRFKVTGSGKIVRQSAGVRHYMEYKTGRKKAGKRGRIGIAAADKSRVAELLSS